jgi:hypothetical protein
MTTKIAKLCMGSSLAAALVIFLGAPAPAAAQRGRLNPQQVERIQRNQIRQGLKSGQLTKGEAARLAEHEKAINTVKAQDLSKGPMTPQERQQLKNDLSNQEKAIKNVEAGKPTPDPMPTSTSAAPPLG